MADRELHALDFFRRYGLYKKIDGDWKWDPRWKTSTTSQIAERIYTEKLFDEMPILADALEEAGCIDQTILGLLRNPEVPWYQHCDILRLLTGRIHFRVYQSMNPCAEIPLDESGPCNFSRPEPVMHSEYIRALRAK